MWAGVIGEISSVFGVDVGLVCGGFWVGLCVLTCWGVVWGCINHCLMVRWCLLCSFGLILVGWAWFGVIWCDLV